MKILSIIAVFSGCAIMAASCNDVKRTRGKAYMPDMMDSRAYEAYSVTQEQREELEKQGINFSNLPVAGTVKRGELFPYSLPNTDSGYAASASVRNPLPALDVADMARAERLYLIHCGICHGQNLDGNGPLWKDGSGPYAAAPKNLLSDEIKNLADGTMFHVMTYGKNMMGSYASQLDRKERWMVVKYIRSKQGLGDAPPPPAPVENNSDSSATAKQ